MRYRRRAALALLMVDPHRYPDDALLTILLKHDDDHLQAQSGSGPGPGDGRRPPLCAKLRSYRTRCRQADDAGDGRVDTGCVFQPDAEGCRPLAVIGAGGGENPIGR